MIKDCPKCGLVNPPDAQRCDCGYDFATRTVKPSYLEPKDLESMQSPTPTEWVICILLPVIGLFLGFRARRQGRPGAGRTMLRVSGVMCIVGLAVRLLIQLAH